jgi:hypothetical protein
MKFPTNPSTPSTQSPINHRNSITPTASSGELVSAPMMENTATIIHDPDKVEFFRKFLEAEGTNRDMLFLMDVETYSKRYLVAMVTLIGIELKVRENFKERILNLHILFMPSI